MAAQTRLPVVLPDADEEDLLHRTFVPRYSALSTAEPRPIVLVGVWLLFGPTLLISLPMMVFAGFGAHDGTPLVWLSRAFALAYSALAGLVLWKVTRRYVEAKATSAAVASDDE